MCAAEGAADETVAFLLSKGASSDLMDRDGDTALVYAINSRCSDIIDLLAPVTQKGLGRAQRDNGKFKCSVVLVIDEIR